MILVNPETKEIHTAVGQAVDAYAGVEGAQAQMMEALLKLSAREASIIFYSVQNVRSRHEMIQELLKLRHKDKYKKFWSACWKFLRKLAIFRNALVHWHPILVVYLDESGQNTDDDHDHALGPPMGGDFEAVKASDIPPFLKDCHYIGFAISVNSKGQLDSDGDLASEIYQATRALEAPRGGLA